MEHSNVHEPKWLVRTRCYIHPYVVTRIFSKPLVSLFDLHAEWGICILPHNQDSKPTLSTRQSFSKREREEDSRMKSALEHSRTRIWNTSLAMFLRPHFREWVNDTSTTLLEDLHSHQPNISSSNELVNPNGVLGRFPFNFRSGLVVFRV